MPRGQVIRTSNFDGLSKVTSTTAVNALVVRASAGSLVSFTIFNNAGGARGYYVLNAASIPAGAGADITSILLYPPIYALANTTTKTELTIPIFGSIGITLVASTTLLSGGNWILTYSGTNDHYFYAITS